MEDKKKSMTWVGRLCEGDPDLRCPDHDRMSFLLVDGKTIERLCKDAGMNLQEEAVTGLKNPTLHRIKYHVALEHPITKGDGKYQVVIGFADAFCTISAIVSYDKTKRKHDLDDHVTIIEVRVQEDCRDQTLLIEAKPRIDNPMETLRQIRTYRQFIDRETSILLWCPTISENVAVIFRGQGVRVADTKIEDLA